MTKKKEEKDKKKALTNNEQLDRAREIQQSTELSIVSRVLMISGNLLLVVWALNLFLAIITARNISAIVNIDWLTLGSLMITGIVINAVFSLVLTKSLTNESKEMLDDQIVSELTSKEKRILFFIGTAMFITQAIILSGICFGCYYLHYEVELEWFKLIPQVGAAFGLWLIGICIDLYAGAAMSFMEWKIVNSIGKSLESDKSSKNKDKTKTKSKYTPYNKNRLTEACKEINDAATNDAYADIYDLIDGDSKRMDCIIQYANNFQTCRKIINDKYKTNVLTMNYLKSNHGDIYKSHEGQKYRTAFTSFVAAWKKVA